MVTGVSNVIDFKARRTACSVCSLKDICLPMDLDQESREALEQIIETIGPLHKGDYLFRQGDPFDAVYAVRSGYVKTYLTTESGEEQVLGFYMPGEMLGLNSIHTEHKRCSAEVLNTSMVCRLPFDELSMACRSIPPLQRQLMRLMSRELVMSESLSAIQTAEERIATFLLSWGERLARQGFSPRHYILPMTRQDIGNYLHLAPETVSRCLGAFVEKGWVDTFRREIKITNELALTAQCHNDWCI